MNDFILNDKAEKSDKKDNLAVAHKLKLAYGGEHGELNSAVLFIYNFYSFKRLNDFEGAELMLNIAVSDLRHFKMLCELMLSLGMDPIYACYPPCQTGFYWSAKKGYSDCPKKMLSDGIAFKLNAINDYKKLLSTAKSFEVEKVVKEILKEEKRHLRLLNAMLKRCDR